MYILLHLGVVCRWYITHYSCTSKGQVSRCVKLVDCYIQLPLEAFIVYLVEIMYVLLRLEVILLKELAFLLPRCYFLESAPANICN